MQPTGETARAGADSAQAAGDVISGWKEAVEHGDADGAAACLASSAELVSPLTAQFRFTGRDQVREVLAVAFQVITGIRYHTDVGDAETRALFYHGRIGRTEVEEAQLLRIGPDGLIGEMTFFGRPVPALTASMAGIGPRLLRSQGKPALAPLVTLALRPLAAVTGAGDRLLVPLARPASPARR